MLFCGKPYAFADCTSLTNVTIPNSVTSIWDGVFGNCKSLTAVNVEADNPAYSSVDGVLFNKNQTALIQYPAGKAESQYTIPNSVTSIGNWAFASCYGLTGVYFQGNAASFGWGAFGNSLNVILYYLPGTTGWSPYINQGWGYNVIPTALWFLPNPLILNNGPGFGVQTNGFGFIISWATNTSVVVEASASLVNPAWTPVSTNTLNDGSSYFSDPEWTNYPSRFYRLRSP